MSDLGFSTTAIWGGCDPEQWAAWDVMPPISVTSIYKQVAPGQFKRYDYSRLGNPTRAVLETSLAQLDNGNHGLVFTSGTAATVAVVNLLSAGDHIVATEDMYCGTMTYLTQIANRMNITTTFVDITNTTNVEKAIQPNTKMIFLESITNPKLQVPDIRAITAVARKRNPEIIVVVDNTFLTPYCLQPLDLGVDIALMSLSKYINGHHDVIMGSLVVKRKDLYEKLFFLQKNLGGVPSATDCYQVIRSIKTFPLRMAKHQENGLAVAKFLETHPRVLKVTHPLLPSHPQQEQFKLQTKGHSGMVSFYLSGTAENSKKFLMSLKVVLLATSLGGVTSTVGLPGLMNATDLDEKAVQERELPPTFVRFSVGLEDEKDIIEDLRQALDKAYGEPEQ